jgi:hypothetical protein
MSDVKYDRLMNVLMAAYDQGAKGKGKERHSSGLPFENQPLKDIQKLVGVGFSFGQAIKKLQESQKMLDRGSIEAAKTEILGAIVYCAGAHVYIEDELEEGKDAAVER